MTACPYTVKFSCPKCRSEVVIQETFNKMMHVACTACGLEDVAGFARNPDEVFLEFLTRYDRGINAGPPKEMVRPKDQIDEMIKQGTPDPITHKILYSKKDYVSQYKVLQESDPAMGCKVEEMGLDHSITGHLSGLGIKRFYSFQQEAITRILQGANVVIVAPTASGKTEAFLVPVIQKAAKAKPGIFAVFVYPTKALARDQFPKIERFAQNASLRAQVFDGDTDSRQRQHILDDPPHILVTNFDILHYHMWRQTRLAALIMTVQMLIVDEAHVYSGIFGSNIHYIIKRLSRLCPDKIQFVAASATLDNAAEFSKDLFGKEMSVMYGSGRKGRTDFVMLFPSLWTQRALMVDLADRLTREKHKTMIFSNSHLNSELFAIQAAKRKVNVKVHRAGLAAGYRTAVERQFRDGELDAISCTPTLELGIDIGDVDAVISAAVPVNRLMQRIGRAARKGQRGYAFLALGNDPISQYYKNHPDDYFEDRQATYIDPKNPFIEEFQILAAACDRPLARHELSEHHDVIRRHIKSGNLRELHGRIVPDLARVVPMLKQYSIRGMGRTIDIYLGGKKVGDRVLPIALEELHKDAIYFLAGTRYKVAGSSYPRRYSAVLERIPRDYPFYTRALKEEWPTILEQYEKRDAYNTEISFCKLRIKKTVYGHINVELGHDIAQGQKVLLDEPLEYDYTTKGVVFAAPAPDDAAGRSDDPEYAKAAGYHAAEHVIIEASNMITGGASQDMGGISMGSSGVIFIYDGATGGSGASRALYDRFEPALRRSMHILQECPCKNAAGCPRCTFSYRCGNNNEYLDKISAREILERISGGQRSTLAGLPDDARPLV